ncbi:MAG: TatD family hydrolase [Actinobacteria bacterium]|nr:TatD family hydrolase [Actinomycetota bacterium]
MKNFNSNIGCDDFYFIDTHAHLDMLKEIKPADAVRESLKERVKYIINVSSSISGSKKAVSYSRQFENVFASIGIHPHDVKGFGNEELNELESMIVEYIEGNYTGTDDVIFGETNYVIPNLTAMVSKNAGRRTKNKNSEKSLEVAAKSSKIVAIGETGFDFYRNLSPKNDQERAFGSQMELALKYKLPLIIHDRDAHEDTLGMIKKYAGDKNFRAVVHCFSGDTEFAMKCIELGLFISFTGVITFPNAKSLAETVKEVPIGRMFLETDAPFLAPQEKRGRENFPGYVKYVAQKIASLKGLSIGEVAKITSGNAEKFFMLK